MSAAGAELLNCDESLMSEERAGPADASPDKSLKTQDAAALLLDGLHGHVGTRMACMATQVRPRAHA